MLAVECTGSHCSIQNGTWLTPSAPVTRKSAPPVLAFEKSKLPSRGIRTWKSVSAAPFGLFTLTWLRYAQAASIQVCAWLWTGSVKKSAHTLRTTSRSELVCARRLRFVPGVKLCQKFVFNIAVASLLFVIERFIYSSQT